MRASAPSRSAGAGEAAGRPGQARVRVDMHMHTSASFDCRVPPDQMGLRSRRLGLGPLFVTDHDTVAGAMSLRERGWAVVVGEEVATAEGELIGLFLEQAVPAGLSPEETVAAIREQGGLVYLEHPYDLSRRSLPEAAIERIAGSIDIVEVFNGRSGPALNARAEELRAILGVPAGAGSDAHTAAEVGRVHVEMEAFSGAGDFLAKLEGGRVVAGRSLLRLRAGALLRSLRASGTGASGRE